MTYVSRYVDPSFLANLHRLDPDLDPVWDPAMCRWIILWRGKEVMVVQTVEGGYCPLDNRILQKLFAADTVKYASQAQFIYNLHLEDDRIYTKKRKERDEYMRSVHRDMLPFLKKRKTVTASKVLE